MAARDKQIIAVRARGCCEYCRSRADFATGSFSVEHIVPVSLGGAAALHNLALACPDCNGHKYNKTGAPDPVGGVVVSLYNPRQQTWNDHFGWSEDFALIVGLTPTGRATVDALQMNRAGVVNMRRVLFAIGLHPPAEVEG